MDELVYSILHLKANPSTKLGLIALTLSGKPMTTRGLNNVLGCSKTYQNYLDLFKDQISSGLVSIYQMKDGNGYTRNHFEINTDNLEE